jgi:hypothetical protein
MKPRRTSDAFRLKAILIHSQPPQKGDDADLPLSLRAGMRALAQTPPGQKRDKQKDAWEAESNWHRNMSFLAGVYALIPPNDSVLKHEAETLLLKMFGRGFAKNKLERFNTAEGRRIRKHGDATWRLVKKVRRQFGLRD